MKIYFGNKGNGINAWEVMLGFLLITLFLMGQSIEWGRRHPNKNIEKVAPICFDTGRFEKDMRSMGY